MKRISIIKENMVANSTPRRLIAVILGNLIIGIGIAGLKLSTMGNDPFCACAMAVSEGLHMGLGTYQALLNLALFVVQVLWGADYIGVGSLINMLLVGYIVQFVSWLVGSTLGDASGMGLAGQLVYMLVSLGIVSFGLSMYQKANLGIAPFDFLSIAMTEHFKNPYFVNRVITDSVCVVVILLCVATRFIGWENSHLGVATVACAFCLGPFVGVFNKIHEKWIR